MFFIIFVLSLLYNNLIMYREFRVGGNNSPFGFIGPILILAVFFAALFFIARGLYILFRFVAPVLFILTLVLDYKVVINFFKTVRDMYRKNWVVALVATILGIVMYPVVTGYLFFKALGSRNMKKFNKKTVKDQNTFTEYEEIVEEEIFLELPVLNKNPEPQKKQEENKYDHLF